MGFYQPSPSPLSYATMNDADMTWDYHADNYPQVSIDEVRLSVFTKGDWRGLFKSLQKAILSDEELTITARRYVGFETDTDYHHLAIDIATYSTNQ